MPAIAAAARQARLPDDDGQHLGHAALLQAAGPRRRHLHPCRHQIYRRPFRCDDGAGHSAASITTAQLKTVMHGLGYCAAPDDCYLALRGLRTLSVRLARHQETALTLARWLQGRPEVARVLHPALPGDPGHALWQRDFGGSSGLFGLVLKPCPPAALAAMLDGMTLFGMGFSWGGYESLLLLTHPETMRSAARLDRRRTDLAAPRRPRGSRRSDRRSRGGLRAAEGRLMTALLDAPEIQRGRPGARHRPAA